MLTVDTAGLELLTGKTKHTYTKILKDETTEYVNLTLKAPTPWEDTNFNITATATCLDVKGNKYEFVGSKKI
ncbi:hypothetical protein [Methanosarcina horonobensis]|uniref:hypothetical protein n=1 Tax=Methanosarcina horonobensis TaxID=418008 RepID=UPI000A840C09|nr:hypothetical protein [Methanosarcina horonobensis]